MLKSMAQLRATKNPKSLMILQGELTLTYTKDEAFMSRNRGMGCRDNYMGFFKDYYRHPKPQTLNPQLTGA